MEVCVDIDAELAVDGDPASGWYLLCVPRPVTLLKTAWRGNQSDLSSESTIHSISGICQR